MAKGFFSEGNRFPSEGLGEPIPEEAVEKAGLISRSRGVIEVEEWTSDTRVPESERGEERRLESESSAKSLNLKAQRGEEFLR